MEPQQQTLDTFVGIETATQTLDESFSSDDSASSQLETIEELVINLKKQTEFLHHRVDTIQQLFTAEQFEYDTQPIQPRTQAAKELLECIGIDQTGLTLGAFLRSLNQWLIHTERVDLNDLQILMSPLLASAFQLPTNLPKVAYPMFLMNLHKCFL
jgi:DNA repair ATPase RecN